MKYHNFSVNLRIKRGLKGNFALRHKKALFVWEI